MRKVVVTGGAGFVGRHLVAALLARGDEVHCVDSLDPLGGGRDPRLVPWPGLDPLAHPHFHFHAEDCRAFFARRTDDDLDLVFHLAAVVGGRMTLEQRPLDVAEDLAIDAGLVRWAAQVRPRKLVLFSSSAVYPVRLQRAEGHRPLVEADVDFERDLGVPDLVYGWAKLTLERLARIAYDTHGLRSVVYRPFSGYGEDQDAAYPFPSILGRVRAARDGEVVTVWGSGAQQRDFVHVDDCVEAVLATCETVDDARPVNLSTGVGTSMAELAALAAEVRGVRVSVRGTAGTPEGVFARVGDTARQRALGVVHRTSLTEGVARALGVR